MTFIDALKYTVCCMCVSYVLRNCSLVICWLTMGFLAISSLDDSDFKSTVPSVFHFLLHRADC